MSMTDEHLELLIGKLLDGEIAPGEREVLEAELGQNHRAQELLEQLQTLRDGSREAIASRVLAVGAGPDETLQRARQGAKCVSGRRIAVAGGHLRFAMGLAAGFVLGLALHFTLVWGGGPQILPAARPPVATDTQPEATGNDGVFPVAFSETARPPVRKVDYYGFTDRQGNQWIVEGVREGVVRPAASYGEI